MSEVDVSQRLKDNYAGYYEEGDSEFRQTSG